jgi:hypothetical protein
MDILINTLPDILILININIRYAILESIPNRLTASILSALTSIFKILKIKLLESAEEAFFVSKPALKYLDKKNVD